MLKTILYIGLSWFLLVVLLVWLGLNGLQLPFEVPLCLVKAEPENYIHPQLTFFDPCNRINLFFLALLVPASGLTYFFTRDAESLKKLSLTVILCIVLLYGLEFSVRVFSPKFAKECASLEKQIAEHKGMIDEFSKSPETVLSEVKSCRKIYSNIFPISLILTGVVMLIYFGIKVNLRKKKQPNIHKKKNSQ